MRASSEGILEELGQLLFAPFADRARGRALVIVPHGELHGLPFHAFRLDGVPLIATAELSYELTATRLARRSSSPAARSGRVLVVGVETPSLPEITREVRNLDAIYGEAVERIDPTALIERLDTNPPRGGILHVAAHSFFQSRNPALTALSLGESFLSPRDVMYRALDLDLVVLSGCDTGRQHHWGGDEVFGLSRAFLGAGTRTVLASVSPVEDAVALRFMSTFYAELASGCTVRRAVTAAQRALRDADPASSAWAAFTLTGDPDLRLPSTNTRS